MENKPSYFAVIPAEVRYDNDLPDKAKLLYGEISALFNKEGYCWASNNYFADLYGLHSRSISRLISQLKDSGYITLQYTYKPDSKEIEKRTIKINTYSQNCEEGYSQKSDGGIHKIVTDNNTRKNKTRINNAHPEETTSETTDNELEEQFNLWWLNYPRKVGKTPALKSFKKALTKTDFNTLLTGLEKYIGYIKENKTETRFIKHPTSWLNQESWLDEYNTGCSGSDDFLDEIERRIKNG